MHEHEALSDKLECSKCSCLLSAHGILTECDKGVNGEATVDDGRPLLSSANAATSSSEFSSFLSVFIMGLLVLPNLCTLLPAGPKTGLASESAKFHDLTLGAPDI
ncbi:hypothetical protein LOK49_LG07G01187 [Camellia lanceoleosa]|uniref:Uncharacterized protein n=1 Tax=Camellia lanceoleosa TaxID=1840588 RepID=A0ACC0H2U2_9ERIC|nr:hypothetical protein LOK49_LG07G01187 [Camellia lanceoleosa]